MSHNLSSSIRILFTTVLLLTITAAHADVADSTATEVKNKNLIGKVIDYFNKSNSDNRDKKFDFSIIGGPHYSSDTKFGIGLVAAGLYRTDRTDSITQPSNVSLFGDISSVGFYLLGIRGTHLFPQDKYRINYKVYFFSFPSKFWGIGYDRAICDANETDYKRLQAEFQCDFSVRIGSHIFIGPLIQYAFINGRHVKNPLLWNGEDLTTRNYGAGFTMSYDSRDIITNAYEGLYLSLEQKFYPRFLSNDYAFSSTSFEASNYNRLWKGAVLATQLHATFTYGDTPWGMLATFGGGKSMRGYYEGRFRDKNEIDATVELRQKVWRRNGVALWVGAGTIFPKFSEIRMKRILPNYGIGYRWEFKHRVNVRLDLGFGRHTSGFVFNINEAF